MLFFLGLELVEQRFCAGIDLAKTPQQRPSGTSRCVSIPLLFSPISDRCFVMQLVCADSDAVKGRCAEFGAQVRRALFVDLHRLRPVLHRVAGEPSLRCFFLDSRFLTSVPACFWGNESLVTIKKGSESPLFHRVQGWSSWTRDCTREKPRHSSHLQF